MADPLDNVTAPPIDAVVDAVLSAVATLSFLVSPARAQGVNPSVVDLQAFVEAEIPVRQWGEEDTPANRWMLPVSVYVYFNLPSAKDVTNTSPPVDQRLLKVWAQVTKAVCTFGGDRKLGIPATVFSVEPADPDFGFSDGGGGMAVLSVNFHVTLETAWGDPTRNVG